MLAIPALYVGCGSTAARPANFSPSDPQSFAQTTAGGRAQRLVLQNANNRFVGDWGPISSYVANNWIARFTPDGRMSIEGPGLTARGFYVAHGSYAEVNYRWRDGMEPSDASTAHATYHLSPNGELTFSTGVKEDPPVHLRMMR